MSNLYGKSKSKSKKVTEIDPKYLERPEDPNVMISEDPATIQFLLARAQNQKKGEREAELQAKR